MRNFLFTYLALFLCSAVLFTSCQDDENAIDPDAPTLTSNATTAEVAPGTMAMFTISGALGKDDLQSIEITSTDPDFSISDFSWDGSAGLNNPFTLTPTQAELGFDNLELGLRASDNAGETITYTVTLTDTDQRKSAPLTIDVSTPEITTTLALQFARDTTTNNYSVDADSDKVAVSFNARRGASPLSTITITRDGVNVADSDLIWPGGSMTNPNTLDGSDVDGFTDYAIAFQVPVTGSFVYTITIADDAGNTQAISLTVNKLVSLAGPFTGQFYHMDGASGCTGGYDLVNDVDVSSAGADANRDMLNTDMAPDAFTGSWAAQNGTLYVNATGTGLTADDNKGNAESIYATGNKVGSISNPSVGDLYVARLRGGADYAIIEITNVDASDNSCNAATNNSGIIQFSYYKG